MTYALLWVMIVTLQVAMLILVGVLRYVTRARRRGDPADQADATSRWWWKRLAAARRLSTTAGPGDREIIRKLIQDEHPGVQSAATSCLLRFADEELIALVIDGLAARSAAVRLYQANVLKQRKDLSVPLLLARLRADAPPVKLYAYIYLAEAIATPPCVERVASLSTHPNPEVRVAVAKVLQGASHEEAALVKLLTMLRDPDWRVRAQAARGLSHVRDERVSTELTRALTDQTWWVRFRAGLALASQGEPGQKALQAALTLPDRYARDMAAFVTGLSASSVAELSEE